MKAQEFFNLLNSIIASLDAEDGSSSASPIENLADILDSKQKNIITSLYHEIPDDFFDKPLYFPFSTKQRQTLLDYCGYLRKQAGFWEMNRQYNEEKKLAKEESREIDSGFAEGYGVYVNQLEKGERYNPYTSKKESLKKEQVEYYLYDVVSRLIEKQDELKESALEDLTKYCKDVVSRRFDILSTTLGEIKTKINLLEGRKVTPNFFDSNNNLDFKINRLEGLAEEMQNLHAQLNELTNQQFPNFEAVALLFRAQEEQVQGAFSKARAYTDDEKANGRHSNPFSKFLESLYFVISLGFGRIRTDTESIIERSENRLQNSMGYRP